MQDLMDRGRLPLKQYSLIVTGTNWTTARAVGTPFQTLDGTWKLEGNISGTMSSATNVISLTIQGIIVKAGTQGQAVSMDLLLTSGSVHQPANRFEATAGAATIIVSSAVGNFDNVRTNFNIELDSKPTFCQE